MDEGNYIFKAILEIKNIQNFENDYPSFWGDFSYVFLLKIFLFIFEENLSIFPKFQQNNYENDLQRIF